MSNFLHYLGAFALFVVEIAGLVLLSMLLLAAYLMWLGWREGQKD